MSWASGRWCISKKKTSSVNVRYCRMRSRESRGNWLDSKWIGWKWKSSSINSDCLRQRPARHRGSPCQSTRVTARWEGDHDCVFSAAEEVDCTGEREHGVREDRDKTSDGIDDRSAAPKTTATVVPLPFFNPKRKTATPSIRHTTKAQRETEISEVSALDFRVRPLPIEISRHANQHNRSRPRTPPWAE